MDLTPRQIVFELDKYIIGQDAAKKAVALALRNRYRRSQLSQELREEISGYAASSKNGTVMYAETFAEALVDYLSNGNNASILSIEIYKIVQEDLKNI